MAGAPPGLGPVPPPPPPRQGPAVAAAAAPQPRRSGRWRNSPVKPFRGWSWECCRRPEVPGPGGCRGGGTLPGAGRASGTGHRAPGRWRGWRAVGRPWRSQRCPLSPVRGSLLLIPEGRAWLGGPRSRRCSAGTPGTRGSPCPKGGRSPGTGHREPERVSAPVSRHRHRGTGTPGEAAAPGPAALPGAAGPGGGSALPSRDRDRDRARGLSGGSGPPVMETRYRPRPSAGTAAPSGARPDRAAGTGGVRQSLRDGDEPAPHLPGSAEPGGHRQTARRLRE